MSERTCPSCHEPVAAHQTLCPSCRTPVPSEAGPVAADSSAFTFTAPPPRRTGEAPPAADPTTLAPEPTTVAPPAAAPPAADPTTVAPEPTTEAPSGDDPTRVAPGPWDPGTAGPFTVGAGSAGAPATTDGAGGSWPPAPAAEVTWAAPGRQAPTHPAPEPAAPGRSAGTLGTPGAAVLDERGNLPGGVAGLVAAALVTIGVFLPWIAVEGRDVSGWAASDDAKVLLGIAGVATVVAALLIGGARSLILRLGLVGLGVVALGLGAYEIASASGIEEFDVSLGIGIFLVLAGGVVLAVAGALTRHKRFL